MGGTLSASVKINEAEEEERKIRKYEEEVEKNPYGYGFQEEGDKSKIKWWQWLIYDMRSRIVYVIILAILLGLVIPLIIFLIEGTKSSGTIYGSCLLNKEARLQCLINSREEVDSDKCIAAMCCWENDDTLPFKCFHSFPSAYQYNITFTDTGNSMENNQHVLLAKPNQELLTDIQVSIRSDADEILNIEFFDPEKFPNKAFSFSPSSSDFTHTLKNYTIGSLKVKYGEENTYFFMQVVRTISGGTEESIFDTRLGPILSHKNYTSFSTVLPTKYLYGLKGGQNVVSKDTVTYGVVNGFENAELPFYMVLEKSGFWHAVLLETEYPFFVQLVNMPAVMFHIEGPMVSVNLKFFPGPSEQEVLSQFRSYMISKTNREPTMPPYWGFGLHLCGENRTLDDLLELENIPYDSDCIDENLRMPYTFDEDEYPEINEIVEYLTTNKSRKIMLALNLAIPETYEISEPDSEFLVMVNKENSAEPYKGVINNVSVVYPNLFHENSLAWLQEKIMLPNFTFHGMILADNFPKNEKKSWEDCPPPETKLSSLLEYSSSSFVNETWSSLCYDLVHKINSTSSKNHAEVHNIYGHEALVQLDTILQSKSKDTGNSERFLLSGSSLWTDSFPFGGFSGMQVPFTWDGLRDSLAHILRNFILFPFSGTPICGSHMPNNTKFDPDLCLRWFQLALILPFARNSYGAGKVGGPLDFNPVYQNYLINNIKERYTYIPYFYTLFHEYNNNSDAVPPIRPMSFDFHSDEERMITFGLADQFMIGQSLMAVPILSRGLERYAYFPKGGWYELTGNQVWFNATSGGTKTVMGIITQTPLFLRAGYILPLLAKSVGDDVDTAEQSRSGGYSILVTTPMDPGTKSTGSLYVDDGISRISTEESELESVEFSYFVNPAVNESIFSMNATDAYCITDNSISKTINQIKIFGFPSKNVTIIASTGGHAYDYDDDISVLHIYDLNIDWCTYPDANVTIKY